MQIKYITKLKGKGIRITVDPYKFHTIPCQVGKIAIDQQIALQILKKIRDISNKPFLNP